MPRFDANFCNNHLLVETNERRHAYNLLQMLPDGLFSPDPIGISGS